MKKYTVGVLLLLLSSLGVARAQQTLTVPYSGSVQVPQTLPYSGSIPIVITIPSGCTLSGTVTAGLTVTCPVAPPPVSPTISSVIPASGLVGTVVTITGANFGSVQGSSTVTFNGKVASPTNWGATSIVVPVPSGVATGSVVVTVAGLASNGGLFTVTTSPPPGRTKLVPSGGNDAAQIVTAAAKGPIELGCPTTGATCTFTTMELSFPANSDVYVDDNVTVSDMTGYGNYDVMLSLSAANIKLAGSGSATAGLLTMPNSYRRNVTNTNQSSNQYNHCVYFGGASSSSVIGLRLNQCGGDSIYANNSSGILVQNNFSTSPIRNGCSLTDKNTNVTITGNTFANANNLKVAGIADGCDIEPNGSGQASPNSGEYVNGVTISNNTFLNNAGNGLCVCLYFTNSSVPITISVVNNKANGNGLTAFNQDSWPNPINGAITGSGNTVNGSSVNFPSSAGLLQLRKATHKLN